MLENDPPIRIAPVAEEDVAVLEGRLGRGFPAKHRARLELQAGGAAVYLIAWRGGAPVGHVVLHWEAPDEPMASGLGPCPVLSDLFVVAALRSMGIGSRLLEAAEELARERGYRRIALGVATDNHGVRSLYERRGYEEWGLGEYMSRWRETDAGGRERWFEERECCLVKPLLD